jgi:ABC-type sugar transport system ATPase subunit
MGERICIMNRGRIVQTGPPMEVYRNPANSFVAGFLVSGHGRPISRPAMPVGRTATPA